MLNRPESNSVCYTAFRLVTDLPTPGVALEAGPGMKPDRLTQAQLANLLTEPGHRPDEKIIRDAKTALDLFLLKRQLTRESGLSPV